MDLKSNYQRLSNSIQNLIVNHEYTEESKKRDLDRLQTINPDDLLGELKNFQDALLQIIKQQGYRDHSSISLYVTDETSRMGSLIHFFNYGLFNLLYNLFTTEEICASGNWCNLSPSSRMPCIIIALDALEKKLTDCLFKMECEVLIKWNKSDFIKLITTMHNKGFLTADNASALKTNVNDGSISKDAIMEAIQWTPVSNNVSSSTVPAMESLKSDTFFKPGETASNSDNKNNVTCST